jgi:MerR family transcriptional regulator, light-induced transcriptional regulator
MNSKNSSTSRAQESVHYKIGAISSLTQIPVTTLRDWENRYAAFSPTKSAGGHRLYNHSDVQRAKLFKKLSDAGQSISLTAHLSNAELIDLLASLNVALPTLAELSDHELLKKQLHRVRRELTIPVTVVGNALVRRLQSPKFLRAFRRGTIKIIQSFQCAEDAALNETIDAKPQSSSLILITEQTIQPERVAKLIELLDRIKTNPQQPVIVLYQFTQQASIDLLRYNGLILKREPITELELSELITSFTFTDIEASMDSNLKSESIDDMPLIPTRKYSDEELIKISSMSTNIFCECPAHVSDIIYKLTSFEKYSQECLSKNNDDSELHAYLSSVSGTARVLFEQALERIAKHEGFRI